MSDFITLACPSCGGSLRITDDIDRFACKYCGREHLVRREVVAGRQTHVDLVPVVQHLKRIDRKMDRHASELAIQRLRQDRRGLKNLIEDWKRELWAAKGDVGRARGRLIAACVFLLLSFVAVGVLFAADTQSVGVCVLAVIGLIGVPSLVVLLVQIVNLSKYGREVATARRKLNRLHDDLDEVESELTYHEDVVRR